MSKLYEQDFNLWTQNMAIAIQRRDLNAMDWDNLLEEIEDMGKSEKRSLESYLELLIAHILKLKYWEAEKDRNYTHWQVEVKNFRSRINRLLRRSPSLHQYMENIYPEIFEETKDIWQVEFMIPEDCWIDLQEIMEKEYFG
jgi:hypothetical protein